MEEIISLDEVTKIHVEEWLNGPYDEQSKEIIKHWLQTNPQQIIEAFRLNLQFGTAGIRGIMGIGTNRINIYTIKMAIQGFANYLLKQNLDISVVIGFDSRLHSEDFAFEAAKVLAANNIKVYLFKDLCPLPLLSFGCRLKKCQAGLLFTASHNPPQYNGFKIYLSGGAQVLPPHDTEIIDEIENISSIRGVKFSESPQELIHLIDREIDEPYLSAIQSLQNFPKENNEQGKQLQIVYSSLHGTGSQLLPRALNRWGFTSIQEVESQKIPDGHFTTIEAPNPENSATLQQGIELMADTNADLFLATDSDCDRISCVVNHHGNPVIITGNQIACLCAEYLCATLSAKNKLSKHLAFIKTIVTSELFKEIVESYGATCFNVMAGFKYVGQKMNEWERQSGEYKFIFGAEESLGFLYGSHVQDKDAIISANLICEMALQYKLKGMTLLDQLYEIYKKYGVYREKNISIMCDENYHGQRKIKLAMNKLREQPLSSVLGTPVVSFDDYENSLTTFCKDRQTKFLSYPKANVLTYHLQDGTTLIIRPSGTEPKIKIYVSVKGRPIPSLQEGIEHCDVLADEYGKVLKNKLLS